MKFLSDFLRNLAILAVIGLALYVISPSIMTQVFNLFGTLFGPLIVILLIAAAALPRKRRRY